MHSARSFHSDPTGMRAMVFPRLGAAPITRTLPIPTPGPGQVLVRLHAAGVGRWDLLERDGAFSRAPSMTPSARVGGAATAAGVD